MSNLTPDLNQNNIEHIRKQIALKNTPNTYVANGSDVGRIITDFDHFPYTRWFRGVYYYPDPIIAEREAGFRPIQNSCYSVVQPYVQEPQPNTCFESACNTTYPCYGKDNTNMNNNCVIEYR